MISWFSRSRIRKYVTLSKKKQDKVRMGLEERLSTQNELLDSALWEARSKASSQQDTSQGEQGEGQR